MRRISLFILSVALIAEPFTVSALTLWQYYKGNLPSIKERSLIYKEGGFFDEYRGTAEQNTNLAEFLSLEKKPIRLGSLAQPSSTVEGTSTAGWTDDGSVVRLNTAADSVGIGTANPPEKLTIVGGNMYLSGNASFSGGTYNFGSSNGSGTSTVSSINGRFGIGTTSPVEEFSVHGDEFVSGTSTVGVLKATSTVETNKIRASSVTYTLPASDGSSGYSLQTNGSGTLSWGATTNLPSNPIASSTILANDGSGNFSWVLGNNNRMNTSSGINISSNTATTTIFQITIPAKTLGFNNAIKTTTYISQFNCTGAATFQLGLAYGNTTATTSSKVTCTNSPGGGEGKIETWLMNASSTSSQLNAFSMETRQDAADNTGAGYVAVTVNQDGTNSTDSTVDQPYALNIKFNNSSGSDTIITKFTVIEQVAR